MSRLLSSANIKTVSLHHIICTDCAGGIPRSYSPIVSRRAESTPPPFSSRSPRRDAPATSHALLRDPLLGYGPSHLGLPELSEEDEELAELDEVAVGRVAEPGLTTP